MDEPFRKRPRLAMFGDRASNDNLDDDLDALRYRNDFLLKSRFESIFEKYSRDFDGIGDEIDLESGDIIVDNGHLQSMKAETDLGLEKEEKGKALLRAMTEAVNHEESYFNEGADEVMTSIEQIAENAAIATEFDDDNIAIPSNNPVPLATTPDSSAGKPQLKSESTSYHSDSDTDSLFDAQSRGRSSSPDSLFEVDSTSNGIGDVADPDNHGSLLASMGSAGSAAEPDHSALLARYGPQIASEIIVMLASAKETAEAHIEPAWRIPSNIIPPRLSSSPALSKLDITTPLKRSLKPAYHPGPDNKLTSSPERNKTLWKIPKYRRSKTTLKRRALKKVRAESEDPLQDGFSGGHTRMSEDREASGSEYEDEEADSAPQEENSDDEDDLDERIESLYKGLCVYCGRQYKGRPGSTSHWISVLTNFEKKQKDDGVHDLAYIAEWHRSRRIVAREPRLVVSDFRTIVELHEGAGLTFAEIVDCKALRTRKMGPRLVEVYDRYRIAPVDEWGEEPEPEPWSEEELQQLEDLCENPIRDLSTFSKQLTGRTNHEIANKLAEMWLAEMGQAIKPAKKEAFDGPMPRTQADGYTKRETRSKYRRDSMEDQLFVKEESEDDLCGP